MNPTTSHSTSQKSQQQQDHPSLMSSSLSENNNTNIPSLIQLSNGCSKHELHHKHTADNSTHEHSSSTHGTSSVIPDQCRQDLEYIYKIIPFVERECSLSFAASNKKKRPRQSQSQAIQDITNLCQFYRSVVAGSFCPHSHFLFRWGRDGVEILPRVTQLVQHLVSIVTLSENNKEQQQQQQQQQQFQREIATTVAQLLNIIPDRSLQKCILTDLMVLSHDLAAISRMKYFSSSSFSSSPPPPPPPIEVLLFQTTQQHIQQNHLKNNDNTATNTTTQQHKEENDDEEDKYYHVVEISTMEELYSFTGGLFRILYQLLNLSRDKRIHDNDSGCCYEPTSSNTLCENLESPWFHCLDDYTLQSQMINAIQQCILSSLPLDDGKYGEEEEQNEEALSSLSSRRRHFGLLSNLVLQSKKEAATLLIMLLSDANLYVTRYAYMMPQITHLVSMAVKVHFQCQYQYEKQEQQQEKQQQDGTDKNEDALLRKDNNSISSSLSSSYANALTDLLRYTIVLLPFQEQCTNEMTWYIRSAALRPLLDCVFYLSRTNTNAAAMHEMDTLETTVSRSIHTCIFTSSSSSSSSLSSPKQQQNQNKKQERCHNNNALRSIASSYCSVHGLYLYLFQLMNQPSLGTIAVEILENILQPILKHPHQYERICTDLWSKVSQLPSKASSLTSSLPPPFALEDVDQTTTTASSLPNSANKKRTRSDSTTTPATHESSLKVSVQQLQIERSPKRSKHHQTEEGTSTVAQSNTSENVHQQHSNYQSSDRMVSADVILAQTLNDAVLSSHQIVLSGTLDTSTTVTSKKVLEKAVLVSNMAHLLLGVVARSMDGEQVYTVGLSHTNNLIQVLCFLLRSLRELHHKELHKNSDPNSDTTKSILSLIVDIGLYSHFTIGYILDCHHDDHQNHPKYTDLKNEIFQISKLLLDTWSSKMNSNEQIASLKSWYDPLTTNNNESEEVRYKRGCYGRCAKFFEAFGVELSTLLHGGSDNEVSTRTCPCCFALSSHIESESNNERTRHHKNNSLEYDNLIYKNAVAKFRFEMLPLGTRLILFTCLRPMDADCTKVTDQELHPSSVGVTSISQIICRTLEQPELFPKLHIVATVSCIPVLASSIAFRSNCNDSNGAFDASSVKTGSTVTSQLFESLSRFQLLQFLPPGQTTSAIGGSATAVNDQVMYGALNRFFTILDTGRKPGDISVKISKMMQNAHFFSSFIASPASLQYWGNTYNGEEMNILETKYHSFQAHLLSTKIARGNGGLHSDFRLRRWQLIAWACFNSTRSDIRKSNAHRLATVYGRDNESYTNTRDNLPSPLWLLEVPFVDNDSDLRDYASRSLGRILLGNSCNLMYALFSTEEEWEVLLSSEMDRGNHFEDQIIARFFRFIDNLLQYQWSVPPSRVFVTVNHNSSTKDSVAANSISNSSSLEGLSKAFPYLKSALYTLSSLCQNANLESNFGVLVFEHALHRIVRFWTTFEEQQREDGDSLVSDKSLTRYALSSLAFGEMSRLNLPFFLKTVVSRKYLMEAFLPVLLSDILVPRCTPEALEHTTNIPDRRYRFLLLFIQSFLVLPNSQPISPDKSERPLVRRKRFLSLADVRNFLQDALPNILPALITEQDYSALRLVTDFNLFLIREKRRLERVEKAIVINDKLSPTFLVGNSMLPSNLTIKGLATTALDEQMKMLCLSPDCIEQIIPRLLVHGDRSPLVFFLRTVVKEKLTLPQMIRSAQNKILKNLILRLGDPGIYDDRSIFDDQTTHSGDSRVVQGIIKGALALDQEKTSSALKEEDSKGAGTRKSMGADAVETSARRRIGDEAASKWVSSNFMYVLVNVVQQRWNFKTTRENIQSLRCLRAMLQFLQPADSAQYLPQIMATVNMAMSDENDSSDHERAGLGHLRLLAAQALSKYVRIVIEHDVSAIEQEFTTIVVSLFPVLTQKEGSQLDSNQFCLIKEACKAAVDLLGWMTSGELGKKLAPMFAEIPFLPTSSHLDNVRVALRENGVDFDTLLTLTDAHNTQQQTPHAKDDNSTTSGKSSSDGDSLPQQRYSAYMQAALQKRLEMLRKLLSHGNTSVRKVVLEHLIDLLRANRGLFHKIVETQDGGSIERFVTVVFSNSDLVESYSSGANKGPEHRSDHFALGISVGGVKELLEALLSRCSLEEDRCNRVLLATCLGEIGGLDSNHIGEVNVTPPENCEGSNSWRLTQPPWKSRAARYELHLVTKHLPMALKAAQTSSDQHKIAFTIQQLLVLLDSSVPGSGSGEDDCKDGTRSKTSTKKSTDTVGTGPTSKRREKMSPWLVGNLEEAGVLADIEPYWSTNFGETDAYSSRKPPFFRPATSYFNWVSRWSGFMIMQSKNNMKSRWQGLFYACRTAMRSVAGIAITEFLLPFLVLDAICFGASIDERVVLQELQDALTFSAERHDALHLESGESPGQGMSRDERQKAVNTAFSIIDTLQYWAENETESRHSNARSSSKQPNSTLNRSRSVSNDASSEFWASDESIIKIEDFVKSVPLSLRANAAASVGMHARSLRLLEMDARSHLVGSLFDNTGDQGSRGKAEQDDQRQQSISYHILHGIDTGLMKQILGRLDDCETMKAVAQDSSRVGHSSNIIDSIKEKEAYGDWSGALQDYEMALQLSGDRQRAAILERGMLKCLLELGQFESVINQANGIVHREYMHRNGHKNNGDFSLASLSSENAIPSAIEAAWRLGRWSTLQDLLENSDNPNDRQYQLDVESRYQVCVGQAMVGLRTKSRLMVADAVTEARQALMTAISSSVQESYTRSYPHLLRFHCLREIEDASDCLCPHNQGCVLFSSIADAASSQEPGGLSWDDRLDRVSSSGSAAIINVRLALAKLGEDSNLEGSLYLNVGKRARKSGLIHIAEKSLAQAEAAFLTLRNSTLGMEKLIKLDDSLTSIRVQMAKVKHMNGESSSALRIIGEDSIHELVGKDTENLRSYVSSVELKKYPMVGNVAQTDVADIVARFARSLFQSTQWMVEGGLKGGSEVMNRFRVVQKLSPQLEKGYFYFAKYADSLLENRITALASHNSQLGIDDDTRRASVFLQDASCQSYLLLSMQQYGEALNLNQKHVYQALPRLLTLWFDFTSIPTDELNSLGNNTGSGGPNCHNLLYNNQGHANELMIKLIRSIPSHSFYTSLAQLISRVGHRDRDTVQVVVAILKRVLVKFPSQAMWPLAWLRNSSNKERSSTGEEIFLGAIKSLQKSKNQEMHNLLVASKSLCKYLIDLAKYNPKDANARSFSVRPWKGEVELSAFIPPVQAALSILPALLGRGKTYDATQTLVPRMRSFSPAVTVMASKARPKKVKVYVIPARQFRSRLPPSGTNNSSSRAQPGDIGEIHFLLKQEAKGDLRKDARVQDLNNVINRLMVTASSPSRRTATQQRRLHLRTFAVTCLSEDCGILEWVPDTQSLRSLVGASYNPQAAPFSTRRRGKRMSGFGDVHLRKNYERCQEVYKKTGDFVRAGSMFEESCLKPNPPLLYWWFVQKFMDPHAWYEARTRFTSSAAAWSAIGHVIGLGDRHSENILVDTKSGDCVHVDFDCIFDKGLTLPAPEVVPFRLTPNMLDAFGPTGADGIYSGSMKNAMSVLRENRDTLLNVLEPFLKDPVIDWKRSRSHSQTNSKSANAQQVTSAKRSMELIDGRLKGIYNLRNPNIKRFRRKGEGATIQDDEMTHLMPLSVDGQVHKMISEATSHENLVQLYIGWMPWV